MLKIMAVDGAKFHRFMQFLVRWVKNCGKTIESVVVDKWFGYLAGFCRSTMPKSPRSYELGGSSAELGLLSSRPPQVQ